MDMRSGAEKGNERDSCRDYMGGSKSGGRKIDPNILLKRAPLFLQPPHSDYWGPL